MPEQLNERERYATHVAYKIGWDDAMVGEPCDPTKGAGVVESCNPPPDPNLARITELEAELERLNGLLDDLFWGLSEVDGFGDDDNAADRWELAAQVAYVNGREEPNEEDIREGLILCIRNSRRTAEHKGAHRCE